MFFTEFANKMKPTEELDKGCTCGRQLAPIHCKACGSSNIYNVAKMSRSAHLPSVSVPGGIIEVTCRGFKCRKCGNIFMEQDECGAPSITIVKKEELEKILLVKELIILEEQLSRLILQLKLMKLEFLLKLQE